ncbi:hypothetical protein ANRL3_01718 [Anaerolineae bacterium]|nr:hypothetical protein ANRL3_01718 [Anaerolineae bacterium]
MGQAQDQVRVVQGIVDGLALSEQCLKVTRVEVPALVVDVQVRRAKFALEAAQHFAHRQMRFDRHELKCCCRAA